MGRTTGCIKNASALGKKTGGGLGGVYGKGKKIPAKELLASTTQSISNRDKEKGRHFPGWRLVGRQRGRNAGGEKKGRHKRRKKARASSGEGEQRSGIAC